MFLKCVVADAASIALLFLQIHCVTEVMFFHMSLWLNLSREDDGTLPYEMNKLFILLTLTEVMLLVYIFETHCTYNIVCTCACLNVRLLGPVF